MNLSTHSLDGYSDTMPRFTRPSFIQTADVLLIGLSGTQKSIITDYAAMRGIIGSYLDLDNVHDVAALWTVCVDCPEIIPSIYSIEINTRRLASFRRGPCRVHSTSDIDEIERQKYWASIFIDAIPIPAERRFDLTELAIEDFVTILQQQLKLE